MKTVLHIVFLAVLAGMPSVFAESSSLSDSLQSVFRQIPEDIPTFDSTTTLEEYLRLGARECCGLRASFYRWQSARTMVGSVGVLENPIASYQYGYREFSDPLGGKLHKFGLMQPIPWPGTLGAKKRAALRMSEATFQEFELERLMTRMDIKKAYYEYYLAWRQIELTRANLELMISYESVVRTRYQAGLAMYPELARVQIELAQMESMLETMERMLSPARVKILAILNLPDTISLPIPSNFPIYEQNIDRDTLIAHSVKHSPELLAVLQEIESQREEVTLAVKEARPEFMVGIEYERSVLLDNMTGIEETMNDYMVGVQMTVPLWFGKNRAMRKAAEFKVQSTEYIHQEKRNDIVAMVTMTHFEHEDALRRMRLYRDGLIPKAREALNVTFTAYQAGETQFLMLLESQQQLLGFELSFERARVEAALKLAELEVLSGQEIDIKITKKSYMEEY